jgi:chorismate mutase
MENHVERLDLLRKSIDRFDQELLVILAKRMEIVREVGKLKKNAGLPVLQENRYLELKASFIEKAGRQGLDGSLAAALIEAIHDSSVRIQKSILEEQVF